MAEKKNLRSRQTREGRGKMMPGVSGARIGPGYSLWGGGETIAAVAPLRDLAAILRSEAGRNTIFTIDVEGFGTSEVMFHDRQIDPVRVA